MNQLNALEKWLDENFEFISLPTLISQRPLDETEPFYLDLELLKGGSKYDSAIEASLNEWLDTFDNELLFDDNYESGPFEKLAWYNQIAFHGLGAGIYITLEGLGLYGNRIRRAMRAASTGPEIGRISLLAAYHVLLCHELFHHRVEWFAFKIGNSFQRDAIQTYIDYSFKVYSPHADPYDDDLLEEALASAAMFHSLGQLGGNNLFTKIELNAIRTALKAGFPIKPPGYRKASEYISRKRYKIGLRNLGKSIHDASLHLSSQPLIKPHFLIGTSALDKFFVNTVQVVTIGDTKIISKYPFLGLSVPQRKITELLRKYGYEPTNKGKGSHTVWESQGRPSITLPQRSDQEGYKVLQNITRSLGLENLRELQNEIQSL